MGVVEEILGDSSMLFGLVSLLLDALVIGEESDEPSSDGSGSGCGDRIFGMGVAEPVVGLEDELEAGGNLKVGVGVELGFSSLSRLFVLVEVLEANSCPLGILAEGSGPGWP